MAQIEKLSFFRLDFKKIMAQIEKLSSLRLGETFIILPNELKSILGEGVKIYNFTFPSEYYIFSSSDPWTHTCNVYSSSSACTSLILPSDILVIKFY